MTEIDTATADTATAPIITDADRTQYQEQGYMILERVLPEPMLAMLREECSYFIGHTDGQMDVRDEKQSGKNYRGRRYFIANQYRMSHRMWRYIYSDLMAEICRATLGEDAYLFYEQWVVKGPEQGMKFPWHQDSGYVKSDDPGTVHKPYLTCWCALDDVTEANGTVYILPHDRAGTRDQIIDHTQDPETRDLIGYSGDDPGIPVICPAGSIVAFTSYTLHRSGSNTSPNTRRVYLTQYGSEPIRHSQTSELKSQAVPFLQGGRNVYDPQKDYQGEHK